MFMAHAAGLGTGIPIVLNLDGETIAGTQTDPADSYARVKIDDDGNVYKSTDTGVASWVQIDTAADWIRPANRAPSDYEVRFTGLTGAAIDSSTVAEDTWHALSSGDFSVTQARTVLGTDSSTFTIEIRKGSSGGALVSASYTLTAEVESGA